MFPVFAIAFLLGGVTPSEFRHTVVLLCNTLFFSFAIGIFVSAVSRNPLDRQAQTGGWNRISPIGLRAQTCWAVPDRRTLRDTHINWRSAWRATPQSENTSDGAAMIFRSRVDGNMPIRRSGPRSMPVARNDEVAGDP